MCGIAGIISFDSSISIQKIKRFTDSMVHRGPDGGDHVLLNENKIAFGHRRLSIIDLTDGGKQPMSWQERYTITFNGEIYNFLEIKKQLEANGVKFRSRSDTEVILAAYEKWGLESFNKFNGMWAIALYDAATKKLLFIRDRFGVKPLYYTFQPKKIFAFASETNAFRYLDDFELRSNEDALISAIDNPVYLEGTGSTIWKDIYQMLPGHYIEFNFDQPLVVQKRWFEISKKKENLSYDQAKEKFLGLLQNSVKLRLRSDVPIATALSGGLDSSTIYAILYHLRSKKISEERVDFNSIKGFVATFDGTIQDEREYAEEVVKFCKGEAEFLRTDFSTIISNIESSTKLFNDISATPISVLGDVYKGMRANKRVVSLDGHGADEMLYGYRSLVGMAISQAIEELNEPYEKDLSETYLNMFHPDVIEEEKQKLNKRSARYKEILGINNVLGKIKFGLKKKAKGSFKASDYFQMSTDISDKHLKISKVAPFKQLSDRPIDLSYYPTAEKEQAIDFYYRNIPYNMRDFDRAAMQHGVEIRMPFMDYELVNFIFNLPMEYKVGNGYTKRIMRDSMKGILSEKVRMRKSKIGMGAPIHDWFNHQLNEYILDTVHSPKFLRNNLWHGDRLRDDVIAKCKAKSWKMEDAQQFWCILNAHIVIS